MKTRSAGAHKPVQEKTPPARKTTGKATTQSPTESSSVTPKPRGRPPKNITKTPPLDSAEQGSPDTQQVTPKTTSSSKPATGKALARTKTPTSAKSVLKKTSNSGKAAAKAGKSLNNEEVIEVEAVEFGTEDEHAAEKVVSENKEDDEIMAKEVVDTTRGESTANNGDFAELEQELAVDTVQLLEEKTVIESQEISATNVAKQGKSVIEVEEASTTDILKQDITIIETQELCMTGVLEQEESIQHGESVERNGSAIEVEALVMDVVETLTEPKAVIETEKLPMTDVLKQESIVIEDEVSVNKNGNLIEIEKDLGMNVVELLTDEKTVIETQGSPMTIFVQGQTVIQHVETSLVICGRSEESKESIDVDVLEDSKTDGESKRVDVVAEENMTEICNVEEHHDKDHGVEVQEELQQEGGEGIMEVLEEKEIELSNLKEDGTKDQFEEMQEESMAGGDSNIVEATEDDKTEPSNMDEDSLENKIEKGQDELNVDDEMREVEVAEESKIRPSVLKEDPKEKTAVNDTNLEGSGIKGEMILVDRPNHEESAEEAKTLEEEDMELTAIVQKRKLKRENEIFVGGLDRDTFEEDVRKVFEKMGEIVEVRMHKSCSRTQNNGYAFVMFANKEHATRTLSEMKNPVICGNRCDTAASEDNNSLFLGNICNKWTKEAIQNKLKDYGLEGIQNITLVPDAHREGLSRGFAFIEFSCHADAMVAYKRLQRPDAIFGHHERTVRVAFAEPLPEPNSDVMAQVKSVFVDGLSPHWDETLVRQHFKGYGEIEKILLARNMSTAKRKDFGFVHFTTHEAAVACIESMNTTELDDGNTKIKVKVRLSNPLPRTPAVKGGMLGGFRIGHVGGENFPKYGRGNGPVGHVFNQGNMQQGQRERHQPGRIGFPGESAIDNRYPELHTRQGFERGGRGFLGDSYHASGSSAVSTGQSRPFPDRPRNNSIDVGRGSQDLLRRQAFPPGGFERPFHGSHSKDPYRYDNVQGMKRPFHPTDPGYMERSRLRPRLGYSNQPVSYPESQHHDVVATGSIVYPPDSYGSNYGRGAPSPFYGGDRLHDGGYGVPRPHDIGNGGARPLDHGYGGVRPLGRGYAGAHPHGGGVGGDNRHGSGYY